MKTELSLAITKSMPGGRSCRTLGSNSRTSAEIVSGLAVALRMIPADTEGTPLRRTMERSLAGACSMRATSRRRTV